MDNTKKCHLCGERAILGLFWRRLPGHWICPSCSARTRTLRRWFEQRHSRLRQAGLPIATGSIKLAEPLGQLRRWKGNGCLEDLVKLIAPRLPVTLGQYKIVFGSVGYTTGANVTRGEDGFKITVSNILSNNYEALPGVVVHELMHVVADSYPLRFDSPREYEELVDLAGILLGFGTHMARARFAESSKEIFISGETITTHRPVHVLGYIDNRQTGYSLAHFLHTNDVPIEKAKGSLAAGIWKKLDEGLRLHELALLSGTAETARPLESHKHAESEALTLTCPVCFAKARVPSRTIYRTGTVRIQCPGCRSTLWFDGTRVVRFAERIR